MRSAIGAKALTELGVGCLGVERVADGVVGEDASEDGHVVGEDYGVLVAEE